MKIKLINLTLINFKGVRDLTIDFGALTNISGANATGKTTIFDAFTWLLFDKDSKGVKDFNIITLDENNQPLKKADHEVTGCLWVDDVSVTLKKVYRQKWVKSKGEPAPQFSGHETAYFHNGLPVKQSEYKAIVNGIVDEGVFKLLTSPYHFQTLPWQERRKIIEGLVPAMSAEDIIDSMATLFNKEEILNLTNIVNKNKNLEQHRLQLQAKRKQLKTELETIPVRIQEQQRLMPDEINVGEVAAESEKLTSQIAAIEAEMFDATEAAKNANAQLTERFRYLQDLKSEADDIFYMTEKQVKKEESDKLNTVKDRNENKNRLLQWIARNNATISNTEKQIKLLTEEKNALTEKWHARNAEQFTYPSLEFNDNDFICPACNRPLESADTENSKLQMQKQYEEKMRLAETEFNNSKLSELKRITLQGQEKRQGIELLEKSLVTAKENNSKYEQELSLLDMATENKVDDQDPIDIIATRLTQNNEYTDLRQRISVLENELKDKKTENPNLTEKVKQRDQLRSQLDSLNATLVKNEQREKINQRIAELETQETKLAQEIAALERDQYHIDAYTKRRIELVEQKVNAKFKFCTFKLFERLINESEQPVCVTLINGVPFTDANHAAQINAGIDIINTLSDHYHVQAPIFVDNAEAVNELIETKSQLIRLVVSSDPVLQLEHIKKNHF